MHLAKITYSLSNCPCCADACDVEAGDVALDDRAPDDEPTFATLLEPPHAAANRTRPTAATIATVRRSVSGDIRRGL
jgi:hypothetical protein